jgi:histidinol-phosphate aminotransferase
MTKDGIERWIRPEVKALSAYAVPSAAGMIKLDAMENPYPLPAELRSEWAACLGAVDVNRYPDARSEGLKSALRQSLTLPEDWSLMLGNGSDELLQLVMLSLAQPGARVLVPEPSFSMYRVLAVMLGLEYVGVPLRAESFELDVPAMREALAEHKPALLLLCYPNNPTGNLFNAQEVLALAQAAPGLVLIDEAYFHYAQSSMLPAVAGCQNVIVLRTLSKLGLAGLRLGVLSGPSDWMAEFEKVRLPYNINSLSQAAAGFVLRNMGVLEKQVECIMADRAALLRTLQERPNVESWPSRTNFLLIRLRGRGDSIVRGLADQGVLVKNLHGSHPLLEDCLRVTIGAPAENDAFLRALDRVL